VLRDGALVPLQTDDAAGTVAYGRKTGTQAAIVAIDKGDSAATVAVPVTGDTAIEGNETFQVLVSNVVGASLADGTATGSIRNDDTKLSIADVSVIEGNSSTKQATFTVKLSNPSAGPVTFNIATANKTASYGTDYAAHSLSAQTIPADGWSFRDGAQSPCAMSTTILRTICSGESSRFARRASALAPRPSRLTTIRSPSRPQSLTSDRASMFLENILVIGSTEICGLMSAWLPWSASACAVSSSMKLQVLASAFRRPVLSSRQKALSLGRIA